MRACGVMTLWSWLCRVARSRDDALHAGEADAELVLQQLTDARGMRRLPRWSMSSVVPMPWPRPFR